MFIDAAISYPARAFAMLTRGFIAQHAHADPREVPREVLRDIGLGLDVAPVCRGARCR